MTQVCVGRIKISTCLKVWSTFAVRPTNVKHTVTGAYQTLNARLTHTWSTLVKRSTSAQTNITCRAPAIRKMVIGGRKEAQISFIPSCRGTHWKLENQCLVNFKSCKSVEIMGCILLHMTFYNGVLENEGIHTKFVISPLLPILHH